MEVQRRLKVLVFLLFAGCLTGIAAAQTKITIQTDRGKAISPVLFGIFFEDISYAADGGLYAEMVQNRSFEYSPLDHPSWHAFTSWEVIGRNGGRATYYIGDAAPVHPNNPRYLELDCQAAGTDSAAGIINSGFDGIALKGGQKYLFSVFARQQPGRNFRLEARLESKDGTLRGQAEIPALTAEWARYTAAIEANQDDEDARLVLLARGDRGVVYLDIISLFPEKTFRGRPNGLRVDLAQALADLKPRFMRFPGGCLVHGDGLNNMYHWKDTIGPVEQRKAQKNIWRYHQTAGLGYFEYFQFCKDIGAEPVPVVAAGVSCQNSDRYWGVGQQAILLEKMEAYVQDVLDLIEWANGPATSRWGSKRAAAGHPKPFGLKYLAVGNEDAQTPAFRERFKIIYDAVKARHPEITVIGNVGPAPDGRDFEQGWDFANQLGVELVAEHYYRDPQWFLNNNNRYDLYDRSKAKVFVAEYAAHDEGRRTTLRSALSEAAMMTGFERNGDIVHMACYAPLFGKIGHTRWNPNLIYFTNTSIFPTINYYVQQMFGANLGDIYFPTTVSHPEQASDLSISCVQDSRTEELILKLVNAGASPKPLRFELTGVAVISPHAVKTVLTGAPLAVNDAGMAEPLAPIISTLAVGPAFDYEAPAYSLTVIRMQRKKQ